MSRWSATRSTDGRDSDDYAVQQYKQCVEDIHRCQPDLPMGAVQKLALERCAKLNQDQERDGRRGKRPEFLRGMMAKLRLGNKHPRGSGSSDAEPPGDDEIDRVVGSLEEGPSYASGGKRAPQRSLAPRQSVASLSSGDRNLVASAVQSTSSDSDRSLEDSLENIEESNNSPHRRRNSRRRRSSGKHTNQASHRMSNISLDLSDVEEDKSLGGDDHNNSTGKGNSSQSWKRRSNQSSQNNSAQFERRLSGVLPDEIATVLNRYNPGRKSPAGQRKSSQGSVASDQSKNSGRSGRRKRSSLLSSFVSVDSENFAGDFSAWSRRGSQLTVDSEKNFAGDFSAWERRESQN